jgi:hypothetical protein
MIATRTDSTMMMVMLQEYFKPTLEQYYACKETKL